MRTGNDEILSLQQAAARLNVSADTLRHQVQRGKLNATLVGKTYIVTASEVERYVREVKGKHGPKPGAKRDDGPHVVSRRRFSSPVLPNDGNVENDENDGRGK